MEFYEYLPFWPKLTREQQQYLAQNVTLHHVSKGEVVHNGSEDCVGPLIVVHGQLRGYSFSEEGREVTLYRLFERDVCILSAYCMLNSLQFDISVQAEKDCILYRIPAPVYKKLMQESAPVANYTTELIASRFSDVMWLLDQILYKHLDSRLAAFLVGEAQLNDTTELRLTHEEIAHHLGSAREVVTRMLKYFQTEKMVLIARGCITLLDMDKLRAVAKDSLR